MLRNHTLLRYIIHNVLCWRIKLGLLHLHRLLSSLVDDNEVARHLHLDLLDWCCGHASALPDRTPCITGLGYKGSTLIVYYVL